MSRLASTRNVVHYPESDGEPMADNTLQFTWISLLKWNLEHLFASNPNVFVAGDHLIYPIEGDNITRQAPDVFVAFGPVKKDRGCYKVFEEGGVFPQVIFEVWSPGNRMSRMEKKRQFYEKYGAEEYYIIYPEEPSAGVDGWLHNGAELVPIGEMNGFTSPRLGIRFEVNDFDVRIFGPNGREFRNPADEFEDAERRIEEERHRAQTERREKEKLAAKLRELGIDPDTIT